jgi:trehalose 6-phosphate synthase/phosphatase
MRSGMSIERIVNRQVEDRILERYRQASRRIIFLDYDGTLVPFAEKPEAAVPDEALRRRLERLTADPRNTCVIISGRGREFLDKWFGPLALTLVAEHGAYIRRPGRPWAGATSAPNEDWKQRFMPVLQRYVDRCPGSFVEEKDLSLVWHYRKVDPEVAAPRSQELIDELRQRVSQNSRLQVMEGHKVVEVKPSGYDKGSMALRLLARDSYDFILAIGDDRTDEDLFAALPGEALTFKVGLTGSAARYKLRDQGQVGRLMDRLLEA